MIVVSLMTCPHYESIKSGVLPVLVSRCGGRDRGLGQATARLEVSIQNFTEVL